MSVNALTACVTHKTIQLLTIADVCAKYQDFCIVISDSPRPPGEERVRRGKGEGKEGRGIEFYGSVNVARSKTVRCKFEGKSSTFINQHNRRWSRGEANTLQQVYRRELVFSGLNFEGDVPGTSTFNSNQFKFEGQAAGANL